jgi:hypothetical protein
LTGDCSTNTAWIKLKLLGNIKEGVFFDVCKFGSNRTRIGGGVEEGVGGVWGRGVGVEV